MINIGVLCRNREMFLQTIESMIENNCLNKDKISIFARECVKTDVMTFTPIVMGSASSRGMRFDLIIPEVSMPNITTHEAFKSTSYSYARLRGQ